MTTRTIRTADLKAGDTLEFLGRGYRVTGFEPYVGTLSHIIERVACVEGHGPFMSLERDNTVRIAA